MAVWRVADVAVATEVPRWRVAAVDVVTTLSTVPRWRVADVSVDVTAAVALEPFVTQTATPFAPVTVTAKATGGAADSYVWRVISGGPVTLAGSGPSRSFRAPASRDGGTLVLGVTAISGGVSSPEARATYAVLPHNSFRILADGTLAPRPLPDRPAT